jgi:segregation and condensation protein B
MSTPSIPADPPSATKILTPQKTRRILEAALLTAQEPLAIGELRKLFNNELSAAVISQHLEELREKWHDSGIELTSVASGWRFQTKPDLQPYLERLSQQKAPRYSRAVMETLAIVAYHQPVTRGDIEEIRGVSVSSSILKTLAARGWIDEVGYRNVPGKPALFATTQHFLDDLNLRSLQELPPLEEMKSLIDPDNKQPELPLAEPDDACH